MSTTVGSILNRVESSLLSSPALSAISTIAVAFCASVKFTSPSTAVTLVTVAAALSASALVLYIILLKTLPSALA